MKKNVLIIYSIFFIILLIVFSIFYNYFFINDNQNLSTLKSPLQNHITKNNLKGNIKNIEQFSYNVSLQMGEIIKDSLDRDFYHLSESVSDEGTLFVEFNKRGDIIRKCVYPFENSETIIYKYNERNLLEKEITIDGDDRNSSDIFNISDGNISIKTYNYNNLNQLIETKEYNERYGWNPQTNSREFIVLDTQSYFNDKNGIGAYDFNSKIRLDKQLDFLLTNCFAFTYDSTGNKIKELHYNFFEKTIEESYISFSQKKTINLLKRINKKIEYQYNNQNLLIKKKHTQRKDYLDFSKIITNIFKEDGGISDTNTIIVSTYYNRDSSGKLMTKEINYPKNKLEENGRKNAKYIYNQSDSIIGIFTTYNNQLSHYIRKWDKFDNLIEWRYKESESTNFILLHEWIYEYDHKNNWIKKIQKDKNGEIIYITEREIEYYE